MIYKGDNIVIPYKVNGTTHINNSNDVTIYDMPWYEEKIVYKGGRELIWPGFTNDNMGEPQPNKSSDCLCCYYREPKPDKVVLCDLTGQRYGVFRADSSFSYSPYTFNFSEGGTISGGTYFGCNLGMFDVYKSPYPSNIFIIDRDNGDFWIDKTAALNNGYNHAVFEVGATLLCFTSITKIDLSIRKCNVNNSSEVPRKDYSAWESGSTSVSVSTPIFDSVIAPVFKLYNIRVRGNREVLNDDDKHIMVFAPRFTAWSANNSYHCQLNTLWFACYLY